MEIGEIVVLKVLPLEKWKVINSCPVNYGQGEMFCCTAIDEPKFAIWVKDEEIFHEN